MTDHPIATARTPGGGMPRLRLTISVYGSRLITDRGLDVTGEYCLALLRDSLIESGMKTFNIALEGEEEADVDF